MADRPNNQEPPTPDRDRRPSPPPPNMRMNRSAFGWMMMALFVVTAFLVISQLQGRPQTVTWYEFQQLWADKEIKLDSVKVSPSAIQAVRVSQNEAGGPIQVEIGPGGREFWLKEVGELTGNQFEDKGTRSFIAQYLPHLLLWVIILFAIWFIFFRSLRGMGGGGGMLGSFGKSRHRVTAKDSTGVTFNDVAGVDEAKEECQEIIQFLRDPKKFQKLGARIPRGVLMVGQPGCGKTLLARAIAGEADVPFFSISGSDFVEMFVGVGASRVRDLFKQAKDNSPCIIFLDEIDAVGRRRGGGFTTGGHDEREQTLNAILVEMDGFETNDQVIVIAATNRADVLDPALTRPGRFDRQIAVPAPDVVGRLEILNVHSKRVKIGPDVDMSRLARGTPGFSGADLAAIINEAAISATLLEKDAVEMVDLEEARDRVRYGRSRRSAKIEEDERRATAYHEAGHAVLQKLLPDADPLHKVTIIPRGQALGATFSLPEKDRWGVGRKYLFATMRLLCGGRIAEQRATDDATSGAGQDIKQATQIARAMIVEWGMSDRLGFVRYTHNDAEDTVIPDKDYSDDTARLIDEEIKRLVDEAYADAQRLLDEHWDKVQAVAEALLKFETLSEAEVSKLMAGESLDKPTVIDLLQAEAGKRNDATPEPTPTVEPDADTGGLLPSPA
ncbi:MAG: ATP-dependent zinc metalloprotease FtsH [Phycisphaerales bacterium]|nr:ATP-dependent zinc metalloprotease FtsH [Phycisphaerales bacterium]